MAVDVLLDVAELRDVAKEAGWPTDLTELLASLAYVRSGIDVVHSATSAFSADEYQLMQDFVEQAEAAVSLMLDWMADGVATGRMQLTRRNAKAQAKEKERSTKRRETIRQMSARKDVLINPFDVQPVSRRKAPG